MRRARETKSKVRLEVDMNLRSRIGGLCNETSALATIHPFYRTHTSRITLRFSQHIDNSTTIPTAFKMSSRVGLRFLHTFRQTATRRTQQFAQRRTYQSAAETNVVPPSNQSGFAKFMNSEVGPKTVHFW